MVLRSALWRSIWVTRASKSRSALCHASKESEGRTDVALARRKRWIHLLIASVPVERIMQRCLSMDICSVKELTSALNGSSPHPATPSIVQSIFQFPNVILLPFSRHFVLPSLHSLLTWHGRQLGGVLRRSFFTTRMVRETRVCSRSTSPRLEVLRRWRLATSSSKLSVIRSSMEWRCRL